MDRIYLAIIASAILLMIGAFSLHMTRTADLMPGIRTRSLPQGFNKRGSPDYGQRRMNEARSARHSGITAGSAAGRAGGQGDKGPPMG